MFPDGEKFYPDYQDGKYGFNIDPLRGADTFHPFKQAINFELLSSIKYTDTTTKTLTYTCTSDHEYYLATGGVFGELGTTTAKVLYSSGILGQGSYGYKIHLLKATSGDVIRITGRTANIYGI